MTGERNEPKKFDLEERLLDYAAGIIRLVDSLRPTAAGRHVGGQLLRSGTAPLGHHGEAQAAESMRDFVHKLKIALKELRESFRWLRLIQRADLHNDKDGVSDMANETDQLIRIFCASVRTAQKRIPEKS
ncbi:MAG TPA: four helix bundle protein [Gemmataceae bacterium]|nr:four helix bundle protein [Gemmataceae bacterium]